MHPTNGLTPEMGEISKGASDVALLAGHSSRTREGILDGDHIQLSPTRCVHTREQERIRTCQ